MLLTDAATTQQKTVFRSDALLSDPLWLPDGKSLLLLTRDHSSNYTLHQVGLISFPEAKFRPVTSDINDYSGLSLAADGHTLATVLNQRHWDLYLVPAAGNGQAQPVTSGAPISNFSWTPGGELLINKELQMTMLNPDSGATAMLPVESHGGTAEPSACANGRYFVFLLAGFDGKRSEIIARMDAGGGNLKPLTDGKVDEGPVCSPDGQWVYYRDIANGARLMKVSIEGGTSQVVSDQPVATNVDISPDGKLAAFGTFQHVGEHTDKLALLALDSNKPPQILDFQHVPSGPLRFSHDGKAVVYPVRDRDVDNLWLQPLAGSPGKQITNFKSEHIGDSFGWSADGSKLAIIRGHVDSDVVLIRDAQ